MNPIHEAVFASMTVMITGSAVPGLTAILCVVLAIFRCVTATRVMFALTVCFASVLMTCGGCTTSTLHERVEESVQRGSPGPPEFVRKQFANEIVAWHASATHPALAALFLGSSCVIVAGVGWYLLVFPRTSEAPRTEINPGEYLSLFFAGLAALYAIFESFG